LEGAESTSSLESEEEDEVKGVGAPPVTSSKPAGDKKNKQMDELEKSFAKSNQENQSLKNDLEEQYKALM